MKNIIKNTPIAISGLMLGLAGLGNLIAPYGSIYKTAAGILSAAIALLLISRFIFFYPDCLKDLENSIIASVALTFPMGIMILSTYIKNISHQAALFSWYTAVVLHALLILLFSFKFIINFDIKKVFPSYFIVYVGIVVGTVTAPAFNRIQLGQILFYFGFICYMILLPVVSYRVFKIKQIAKPALPTLAIFTAPAGLCLAGYMSSFSEKNTFIFSLLLALTLISAAAVISYLPKMISIGFYPSFSAFTFPFVITGIGLKMSSIYLKEKFNFSFLKYPALIVELLAVILVIYVFLHYFKFLLNKAKY
ncbi:MULTISPECIES: TDT family transporter [unclassified Halanaerobium]|uniref:TDT family transporter n=1 Tax=unclassified Halanaerobium TaxID=2641197 RepID=UPI000DF283B3|nr:MULTISPECIES: TDT family transporter [unclassified Halanaerobium]RCW48665.1 exfoliative toxin A/B [Halanaerobium sp. MA284_MarDTE_T2]RCW86591.1 exfoliative toxin A/B [Halanaerobium sp. DL-01]